jgi:hypothetical protein
MQLKNYLMSEEKWRLIVAELKKERSRWKKVDKLLGKACGHCKEHDNKCKNCSLEDVLLCDHLIWPIEAEKGYHFLVRMASCLYSTPRNKRKALRIAKRIYQAVLLDDPRTKGD